MKLLVYAIYEKITISMKRLLRNKRILLSRLQETEI